MKIAASPTRDKYPLSKRKILKKVLQRTIPVLLIVLALELTLIAGFYNSNTTAGRQALTSNEASAAAAIALILGFIFLSVITFIVYLYQRWYFAVYYYDAQRDIVVIRKNPITPKEISMPYERIQDVYVDQDLLDRALGLYDVHLSSATITSGMQAHIDGLKKEHASGLRKDILDRIHHKIGKTSETDTEPLHTQPL
jgi:membrane protein YdbS with pleckstrin-like domain